MTRHTYGSLFSGVGGMDMGFDTHMDCVFQVEWDKNCQSVLKRHWPDVPKWYDVQDVNGAEVPPCDVLTFGSPCQDLSVAGKRAGLDGNRSSMFFEAIRIIKEMRNATASRPTGPLPRAVIWENVPGALSSNNGEDFQAVLEALGDIGAVDIQWSVLDAQHFGVPQRRRRIFLVAIFDPAIADRCDGPLLPVCEGRPRDFAKGRAKGEGATGDAQTSFDASGAIPFVKAKRAMSDTDDDRWEATETAPTLNAFDNGGESRATVLMPVAYKFDSLASNSMKSANPNSGCNEVDISSTLDTWIPDPSLNQGGIAIVQQTLTPVAYSVREDAKANTFSATETDTALCLNGLIPSPQSHHAQLFIAEPIPIQDGREMEKNQNGFGVGDVGAPSYTLDQTGAQAVAQPILTHDVVGTLQARQHKGIDCEGTHGGQLVVEAQPIIFDGTRHDDFRMDTEIVPTPKQRMGTGGGQVPMVFEPGAISRTDGERSSTEVVHTLRANMGDNLPAVIQPVTVFQPGTMVRLGGGVWQDQVPTLRAEAKRGDNEPHIAQPVATTMAVRRLTPLECERLMGWPDDHTRYTDTGKEQADTHRYKQCGNGVAAPVARWIAQQLTKIL